MNIHNSLFSMEPPQKQPFDHFCEENENQDRNAQVKSKQCIVQRAESECECNALYDCCLFVEGFQGNRLITHRMKWHVSCSGLIVLFRLFDSFYFYFDQQFTLINQWIALWVQFGLRLFSSEINA